MPRITSDISAELRDFIKDFSEKDNRSFSKTVCILLGNYISVRPKVI